MNPSDESSRFAEVKAVFGDVADLPPEARAHALDLRCADDHELRAAVERLLTAQDSAGRFMLQPTLPADMLVGDNPAPLPAALPFDAVGSFRLRSVLGEGGFGTVYLGEQQHPVRRQVAVKILRSGLMNRQAVARFDVERQILAQMEHPAIARVFEAGTTGAEGDPPAARLPYFVMELVRGQPITHYCDAHRLPLRKRLLLFCDVCRAVHHAHQKGIIHRDIKPANVIVTEIDGRPAPKVIDFGVAKATAPLDGPAVGPALTEVRQLVGTPEYMSPEQVSFGDAATASVDTRSDIYALGVLLYELVAGVTPFDGDELRRLPLVEMQRRICQTDPPRPSTRIDATRTEQAALRACEPAHLRNRLRGELDWIVMRCLEKDPARRYDSAAALADDCTAFLDGRTVAARPSTRLYRAGKFVRRNKLPVGATAVTVLALFVGVVAALAGLYQARFDRDRARRALAAESDARRLAEQHLRFIEDMFGAIRPELARGREVTVREILDVAAARAEGAFQPSPMVEASVRVTFGNAYSAIGLPDRAHAQFSRAVELARAAGAYDRPDAIHMRVEFGQSLSQLGRFDDAETTLRDALSAAAGAPNADPSSRLFAQDRLAAHLLRVNQLDEAEALRLEIRAALSAPGAPDDAYRRRLSITNEADLAHLAHVRGRFDDAEAGYTRAAQRATELLGEDHPDVLAIALNAAALDRERGRFAKAADTMQRVLDRSRALFGNDHPNTLLVAHQAALVMSATGRTDDAETLLVDTIERCRRTLGENHTTTLFARHDLAQIWMLTNRTDPAEQALRDLIPRMHKTLGADHRDTLMFRADLARLLNSRGDFEGARQIHQEVLDALRRTLGDAHFYTQSVRMRLGSTLGSLNRWDQAEPLLAEVYRAKKADGELATDWSSAAAYGACLERLGRHDEAIPVLLEAEQAMRAYPKLDRRTLRRVAAALVSCYAATGQPDRAADYRQVVEAMSASLATRPAPHSPPASAPANR